MIVQQTIRHKKCDDCKLKITGVADVSNLQEGFAMMIIFILGFKSVFIQIPTGPLIIRELVTFSEDKKEPRG